MVRRCDVCDRLLNDGDEIVATIRAIYHEIPSKTAYAMERPTECFDMRHSYCNPKGDE